MKKYLVDSKMFELDKHYKECKKVKQPFIKARINPSTFNYLVVLDMITCDYGLVQDLQTEIKILFQNEINFLSENKEKSKFKGNHIGAEHVWFDGIASSRLEDLCENLFKVACKKNL